MEQLLVVSSVSMWMILVVNLILTFAIIRKVNALSEVSDENGRPMPKIETLELGQLAPYFRAETLNGTTVTLANYAHSSVAFVFLTPKCEPCREAIPTLKALSPKAEQSNIILSSVILANRVEALEFVQELKFIQEFDSTLPVLVAPPEENPFMSDYKVGGTPFYCLINEQGEVEATGFLDRKWRSLTEKWGRQSNEKTFAKIAPAAAMNGET